MIKYFTLLCVLFGGIACSESSSVQSKATEVKEVVGYEPSTIAENSEWQKATIKYFAFEGGFWGIETDTGEKLLPINLAKEYKQNNLEVFIQGKPLEGMMSIHQWGKPFEIVDIKR